MDEFDERDDAPGADDRDAAPETPVRVRYDLSMFLMDVGMYLVLIGASLFFFIINGAFSVEGVEAITKNFEEYGAMVWDMMSRATFALPVSIPTLEARQPVLPWLIVVGSSIVQVAIAYRVLRRLPLPARAVVGGILLSIYDFVTTLFGTAVVPWLDQGGWPVRFVFSALLTFGFEIAVGALLARQMPQPKPDRASTADTADIAPAPQAAP